VPVFITTRVRSRRWRGGSRLGGGGSRRRRGPSKRWRAKQTLAEPSKHWSDERAASDCVLASGEGMGKLYGVAFFSCGVPR